MENTAANVLRNRAAAALSRRRLEERLRHQDRDRERREKMTALVLNIFSLDVRGPKYEDPSLPLEIDGLLFDCSQYGDTWRLNLLQPCIECSQLYSTALNDLADLGELLDEGPSLCERCDC